MPPLLGLPYVAIFGNPGGPDVDATIIPALQQDHRCFVILLDAAAREISALERGGPADLSLLRAIARYFEIWPHRYHHPLEESIYGHLICRMPQFAEKVYRLIDDHHDIADRAKVFSEATARADLKDIAGQKEFTELAGQFIENERAHLAAEEKSLFPYAQRLLTEEQWAEVAREASRREGHSCLSIAKADFPTLAPALGRVA